MSDYKQTRDAAGNVTSQYSQMLQNLNDADSCTSCKEPLDHPSGEGCASMDKHDDKVGYLVITNTVEHEDGSATYSFDLDDKSEKLVAELGLRLILTCAAYDMDIEDAMQTVVDRGEYLSQEQETE